jgi:IS605 OrfB family transposase
MKLVSPVRLLPDCHQAARLQATLEACNNACNWIAGVAQRTGKHRQFDLQRATYAEVRSRFGLSAQAAVRSIAKVADSLKAGRKSVCRSFHRHSAQPYDSRIFRLLDNAVSIWTIGGRIVVPYACGEHQRDRLRAAKGEADLMFVRGKWMLALTCDVEPAAVFQPVDVTGVDLGIVNLACDSDGNTFCGAKIEHVRRRNKSRRRALQKLGTRSAKRALKRASGKQSRFQRHTNHCISKAIVSKAERGRCAVALEDLEGIRDRVKATRRQRERLSNWGFHEMRSLIVYKAALRGVTVLLVDPRNTSRTCPSCAHIDKANRPTRDAFKCVSCGFAGPADHIAAINIRQRGLTANGAVTTP